MTEAGWSFYCWYSKLVTHPRGENPGINEKKEEKSVRRREQMLHVKDMRKKAESTFLTPNKVVFCVCCAETVHGVLQEERRKGVKGDGIKENTKSKKE